MKINKSLFYIIMLMIPVLFALEGLSCKKKETVAEVGDEKITLDEFESQFLKTINNIDSAKSKTIQEKKDFLDLLIKFRLKVKDARERGLLNAPDIQNDIKEYKQNFISTYLVDKKITEPELEKLYERKKYEIRASHILISLSQGASPQDSINAYNKAKEALQKLKDGADFADVAKQYSNDQTVQQNGGDLYYFTAGMTVPEFEDEVYKLKVGEYTKEPVRTMFGLHIIKVTDKKKRVESVKASHILLQEQRDSTGKVIDSIGTYNKVKSIYERIKNGEDFAKLATENSQDPGSAPKGGDLGYFERRRMVQNFDSIAFSLKKNEVSNIVRTPYGWHIIKVTDIKEYPSYEEQKEKLKAEFKRTQQFKDQYNKYIDDQTKKYDLKFNDPGINVLLSKMDTSKTIGSYNVDSLFMNTDKNQIVAEFKDGKTTLGEIQEFLNKNREFAGNLSNRSTVQSIVKKVTEPKILNLVASKENLDKDEEFKNQIKEYEDGLLSFKVDQEELWSKIKLTDADMQQYYTQNQQKYMLTDSSGTKPKPFSEVKSEISNALQQDKFKEMEKQYVDRLKQKYPVKVYDNVLEKAFSDKK
jgi:peptidyl-prolyl cis-trans isomerase SurA